MLNNSHLSKMQISANEVKNLLPCSANINPKGGQADTTQALTNTNIFHISQEPREIFKEPLHLSRINKISNKSNFLHIMNPGLLASIFPLPLSIAYWKDLESFSEITMKCGTKKSSVSLSVWWGFPNAKHLNCRRRDRSRVLTLLNSVGFISEVGGGKG